MAKLSPVFNDQTIDANGAPYVGAKLFTLVAGSSTKQTVYTDEAGTIPHSNPIILDSLGFPTQGAIRIPEGISVKFVLAPPTDTDPPTSPIKTIDNVTGVGDNTVSVSQWVSSGMAPTYISANSFSVPGDQTTAFQPGRREQFTTSGGTVYGNILTSVFTTLTTVTMQMDSAQVLDSGLSVVNHSILLASPSAEPSIKTQSFQMGSAYGNFSVIGAKGATLAAAATTSVFAATDGNLVDISGSGFSITSFGTSQVAGYVVEGKFIGSGALINSANLNLGGADIQINAGDRYRAVANTTSQIDVTITPVIANASSIVSAIGTPTVAANALTIPFLSTRLDFRSTNLLTGVPIPRTSASQSLVVPSSATLGTVNAQQARLACLWIDNAGTLEPAIVNIAGGTNLDETTLISTTAISAAATSASVIYSTLARTNVAFRVAGFIDITEAVAGTWATAPTKVQGVGGQALTALQSLGYGQTWQTVTRVAGTTYYNTTGRPIELRFFVTSTSSASPTVAVTSAGVTTTVSVGTSQTAGNGLSGGLVIPVGAAYVLGVSAGTATVASAQELR